MEPLTPEAAIVAAQAIESETDIEIVRQKAKDLGIKFSGNSALDTIKNKILEHLAAVAKGEVETQNTPAVIDEDDDEPIEVAKAIPAGPTIEELLEMDAKTTKDPVLRRKIIRAKALKVSRVIITNLDPNEAELDSVHVTALNKYTGKRSRIVPFDVPWHVEEILLNQLRSERVVLRKAKKNGKFGVKEYHDPTYVKKYSIEVLPHLTEEERLELAAAQRASGAIDKPV